MQIATESLLKYGLVLKRKQTVETKTSTVENE